MNKRKLTERKAFEKWAATRPGSIYALETVQDLRDGNCYDADDLDLAYAAWLARARRRT